MDTLKKTTETIPLILVDLMNVMYCHMLRIIMVDIGNKTKINDYIKA